MARYVLRANDIGNNFSIIRIFPSKVEVSEMFPYPSKKSS